MTAHARELQLQRTIAEQMAAGDLAAAAASALELRRSFPAGSTGWVLSSVLALVRGDAPGALALVDERLAAAPTDFGAHLQRAECLFALQRRDEAVAAAEAAAAQAPEDAAALDAVATFLVYAKDHARALGYFDAALALKTGIREVRARRAMVRRYLGQFQLADEDYAAILAEYPNDAEALKARGELRTGRADADTLAALEAALAQSGASEEDRIGLYFALAKAYEESGDYPTSWRHLAAGNNLKRSRLRYRATHDTTVVDRIIAGFATALPPAQPESPESPIFIVGLPRTGTTLVDRTLGSHSEVHSAGELSALSEAISTAVARLRPMGDLDWADFAGLQGEIDPRIVATEYVTRVRPWRGSRPRFTDKQPANFYYCGAILRAFPQARIVHMTRHPLAAAYAIYKTLFHNTYPFSYDLGELAEFIVGYRRLMAHWHRLMPGRILDLAYEDMVTAQEASTRRLLDFCGLAYEPQCLEFHRNPATVMTASSVQVRQPLYDSSLDRWRQFSTQLEPVRKRLAAAGIATD